LTLASQQNKSTFDSFLTDGTEQMKNNHCTAHWYRQSHK